MIQELKKQRDKIDMELVQLVAQRFDLSQKIAVEKKMAGQELHLNTDEIEALDKAKIAGNNVGLEDTFIADFFATVFKEERKKLL